MSPEVMYADYAGSQSDMWSIGVMTYVLLSGEKPFWGKTPYVRAVCVFVDYLMVASDFTSCL